MLKKRIKKLENNLRLSKINNENGEKVFQFFLSGDESLLPLELSIREVKLTVMKTENKEYKNLPGFMRVVEALLKEEMIKNESSVIEYVKNLQEGRSQKLRFNFGGQHERDPILEKLRLKKVYRFNFGGNEEN